MSDVETQPVPVQPEPHETGIFTADTDEKVEVGPGAQSAFEYAQALITLFDSHTHKEFEAKREFLMQQLVEFGQEFVTVVHLAERHGILPYQRTEQPSE